MKKRLKISDLQAISSRDNGEPLVNLAGVCQTSVLVRKSVAVKLQQVQGRLSPVQLLVVEGYRSPTYQESYFLKQLLTVHRTHPTLAFEELLEQTHRFVALPSVAGHPTGGAVDVTLASSGREMDLGGAIANFPILSFSPPTPP